MNWRIDSMCARSNTTRWLLCCRAMKVSRLENSRRACAWGSGCSPSYTRARPAADALINLTTTFRANVFETVTPMQLSLFHLPPDAVSPTCRALGENMSLCAEASVISIWKARSTTFLPTRPFAVGAIPAPCFLSASADSLLLTTTSSHSLVRTI